MPLERRLIWSLSPFGWDSDRPLVKVIVDETVVKLIADPRANPKSEIGINSDIALIKKAMNIATQQDTVGHLVGGDFAKRTDVCGLECRQCFLTGNGTAAIVRVHNHQSKRTLTKSRRINGRLPLAARHQEQRTHGGLRFTVGQARS